jgi:exodeoxyribonuclease V alpha subunit
LDVLDRTPLRLKEIPGLGKKRRVQITTHWREQRARANLTILLQTHGIGGQLARRILERFAQRAAEVVQHHPYRLALEVRGVGFKTADRIAQSLGISRTHPERAQAGVHHQLLLFTEQGHVCVDRNLLTAASAELLEIPPSDVDAAIDKLWAEQRIVVEGEQVYARSLHDAETSLAAHCARLLQHPAPELRAVETSIVEFERTQGLALAAAQRDAILAVGKHKLVVITGGPGVGKTTIVKAILKVFELAQLTTLLAAPTGRAAKRLAESTARSASTLHRLLEYDPKTRDFQRHKENPLGAQAVIVDEASMIDVQLAQALLAALPDPARLVIVGDADQLPSVGPGAVLRDLIQSARVCVVRLNAIFRQSGQSAIVRNAHRILVGEMPESEPRVAQRVEPADFFIVERTTAEDAARTIEELVTRRIPKRFEARGLMEVQVLCPMHRGPAGTTALNARLQAKLNPTGPALVHAGQTFRVGDRVMQLKNDYEKDVFNGDAGAIVGLDETSQSLRVRFDEREVSYDESSLEQLSLAYAVSIHKSQGSEYPAIVVPFLSAHFVMLSRNLLYTAVTRAKRLCVLVADPKAIKLALSEVRKDERQTGLEARLRALL